LNQPLSFLFLGDGKRIEELPDLLGQVVRQFSGIYLERLKLLKLRQRCAQGAGEGIERYELGPSLANPPSS
jgi:hypothetical protein